ncbi:MAG: response regulator [Bacteroidetes bacterium]|nr:response regulator [Bacteroidota bacterium]
MMIRCMVRPVLRSPLPCHENLNHMMPAVKKTILIVDDDIDFLLQTRMKVESMGYATITAESQKEAGDIISKTRPDMAILDLMMENQDSGFILSFKIKKRYPEVPVIILTGVRAETGIYFDVTDENNRKWIRADAFVDKGIRADVLKVEIERLMK